MRIISLNCNGIRSAGRKGFYDWMKRQKADVVCLQETKAQRADLEADRLYFPRNWHLRLGDAERKGYSGVALYCRREPDTVIDALGVPEFDAEGRYLEARFGNRSVASLYLPSGSSGPERQASKDRFLAFFEPWLAERAADGRDYVLCGDWNIAHREIDLKNWRGNRRNSGFLPHERAFMDRILGGQGWVDAWRALHPDAEGASYTWWSNRGQAWAKNVGWRIDYQVVSASLRASVRRAAIYKARRFSDHAPLTIDYDD